MKKLNIIFISLLTMACIALSCNDDPVESKDIQKIDPVGQLEVYKTNREKEILVKFVRTSYVKDTQIEIAYRNMGAEETGEWTAIMLMVTTINMEEIIYCKFLRKEHMRLQSP